MTKTNATATVAAKTAKAKKVLTEKDIPIGTLPTAKALRDEQEKELRAEAKASGAPRAAQLARGIKTGQAPHSAKALADAAAKVTKAAPAANKADAVQAKAKAKSDAKAARAAKTEAKAADRQSWKTDRPYKVLVKLDDITLRDGTWTKVMVETALSHKDTGSANAALAKHREFGSRKIDWKWLADSRKYIAF